VQKTLLPCLSALLAAASLLPAQDFKARALRLHRQAIVVDTHQDVPYRLEKEWIDLRVRNRTGHIDIPRLKEGGVTASFFAAYVPAAYASAGGAAKKALEQIELIHRLAEQHPEFRFTDSPAGVREAKRQGKIAVLVGIEGGHAIEDSLGALAGFHRLGVRYMTLTHTNTNNWADSSGPFWRHDFDPKKSAVHGGLNDLGRQVVVEMNRLGMLVDISHVSDDTLSNVLEVSKAPVFASHSSCRALSGIPRNLTDEQIRAIAARGGVVMVNIGSMFLDQKSVDEFVRKRSELAPRIAEIEQAHRHDAKTKEKKVSELLGSIPYSPAPWTAAVDHIERFSRSPDRERPG
jgi:membrane dipeptidase